MFHKQGNQRYDDQFFKSDFQAPKKPTKKNARFFHVSWKIVHFLRGELKKNQIE